MQPSMGISWIRIVQEMRVDLDFEVLGLVVSFVRSCARLLVRSILCIAWVSGISFIFSSGARKRRMKVCEAKERLVRGWFRRFDASSFLVPVLVPFSASSKYLKILSPNWVGNTHHSPLLASSGD